MAAPFDLEAIPGSRFGDYELLERIGQGGMGVVYRARQISLDRIVALKLLRLAGSETTPEFIQRFHEEAMAAASLRHPHIVAIHEVGVHAGQHFYVMDYVAGQTLAQVVGHQPLLVRRAARYLQSLAQAVDYAHERGILHRDLKPSNILIDAEDQPQIADFGLAKRLHADSDLTLTGQVLGSPQYIPPEQAEGSAHAATRQSDVYGLGAILYHLLTGRPPFLGEHPTETLLQVLYADPVPPRLLNPLVPRDLQTVCLKCLEKDPASRYSSARFLAEELTRFLEGKPIRARPVGWAGRSWRWCKRQPARAGLVAALILACVAGLGGILWQWGRAAASEAFTRHNLYAADMNLAQQALAGQNVGLAMKLLEAYRPRPGEPDLRGWEWRYFWKQCQGDELLTLGQHDLRSQFVAFSPDSRVLASAAEDTVKLWDLASRKEIASIVHATNREDLGRCSVRFSPTAQLFATAGFIRSVKLWEYPAPVRQLGELVHEGTVLDTAFCSDGTTLAVVTTLARRPAAEPKNLYLWNTADQRLLESYAIKGALCLAASPTEGILAIGNNDGQIVLWDRAAHSVKSVISAHGQPLFKLRFSPDGRRLASTTIPPWLGEGVKVWDPVTLQMVSRFTNHNGWIPNTAFSPDGRRVASAGTDRVLRVWDAEDGREHGCLRGHLEEVWGVDFSSDGRFLASGSKDGEVKLWSTSPKRQPPAFKPLPPDTPYQGYALSPTADTLLLLTTNSQVRVWDTLSFTETGQYPLAVTNLSCATVSAGGRLLAFGTLEGRVILWRPEGNELKRVSTLDGTDAEIWGVEFTRDSRKVASFDSRSLVKVWGVGSGRELATLNLRPARIANLRFSPDGERLAITRAGWVVEIWDLMSGQRQVVLSGHKARVMDAAISARGDFAATASEDAKTKLWELNTGRELATLEGQPFGLYSTAVSADGELLAVGGADGSIKLWDVPLRRSLGTLRHPAQPGMVIGLGFLPDGNTLISVSDEAIVARRAAAWPETERAERDEKPAASR